jgi:MFS family permease
MVAAVAVAMTVMAPVGGHLSDRMGRRAPALAGSVVVLIGLLPLVALTGDLGVAETALLLVVVGSGIGVTGAPVQTTALWAAPRDRVAVAGGVFMTARYTGGIAASGLAAAVTAGPEFATGFAVLAVAAACSVVTAGWLTGRPAPGETRLGLAARADVR